MLYVWYFSYLHINTCIHLHSPSDTLSHHVPYILSSNDTLTLPRTLSESKLWGACDMSVGCEVYLRNFDGYEWVSEWVRSMWAVRCICATLMGMSEEEWGAAHPSLHRCEARILEAIQAIKQQRYPPLQCHITSRDNIIVQEQSSSTSSLFIFLFVARFHSASLYTHSHTCSRSRIFSTSLSLSKHWHFSEISPLQLRGAGALTLHTSYNS